MRRSARGRFQKKIFLWYRVHGRRDLPWRRTRDPYRIFVSEIMLQQTQVSRVLPKYREWVRVFPNWRALERAPFPKVLRAWQGLGYNRRARAHARTARSVVVKDCGLVPRLAD